MLNLDKFQKLHSPEIYMEIENYDTRLAIAKFLSFEETLRHANMALIRADEKLYESEEKHIQNFMRSMFIRHTVLELNSCYDLLAQVPWFYYRVWEQFNDRQPLVKSKNSNLINREGKYTRYIKRNSNNWVHLAEINCSDVKLERFFSWTKDSGAIKLKNKFESFRKIYIKNNSKPFTIRSLANQMKHNNSLIFDEVRDKVTSYKIMSDFDIDLIRDNQSLHIVQNFAEVKTPKKPFAKVVSKLNVTVDNYENEYLVDINYLNGKKEKFKGEDYIQFEKIVKIQDVYDEAIQYGNALLDLYTDIFNVIGSGLISLLASPIANKTNEFDMNKYIKTGKEIVQK